MTTAIDDQELTTSGIELNAKQAKSTLLLACGALAHEVIAIIEQNSWSHMAVKCLPAILHNHPEKITDAVRDVVEKQRDNYTYIYVLYADCGTGGQLQSSCEELGVEMLKGPHCYSFFEGNDAFTAHGDDDITSFYVTDFLARQFESFVVKPLGLDRHPELKDMYFSNYEKLIYQAQVNDPKLDALARQHADYLGLAYERRFTGYGDLEISLKNWTKDQS
ncbi:MAG: DUF1638 domain-containing protein [Halocynthiibacter sp.]